MQINLTFFIQLINFGISYWFLNKFMFKPVLEYLKKRKAKENKIAKDIAKKEHILLSLEHKKGQGLIDFKVDMESRYKLESYKVPDVPHQVPCFVDKKEAEKLVKIAKEMLVKRVPHVD